MPAKTQTKQNKIPGGFPLPKDFVKTENKKPDIPKKRPPNEKALREDLQKRKNALEKKGWKFSENADKTYNGEKHFKHDPHPTAFKGYAKLTELFEYCETLQSDLESINPRAAETEKNIKSETQTERADAVKSDVIARGAADYADTVHYISIKQIIPNSFEPQERRRKTFETEKGRREIEELGDSISRDGLLQPIQLRPIKLQKGFYEIVFGERRFLAHKAKGIETIRCFVRDLTDAQVIELNYKENHKRLAPDPLTDAFTFRYLIDSEDYTEEKLADHFATTARNVRQKLRLNDLIPEARAELETGDLPLKHAYYIATFPEAAQKEIVENGYAYRWQNQEDGAVPFDEFKTEVEENIVRRLADAAFDTSDDRLHLKKLKCGDCADNSDNQPLLFDDRLGASAVCLNKNCFETKTNVHLKLKQEEIALESNRNADVPVEQKIAELALVSTKTRVDKKELPVKGNVLTSQTPLDEPECEFSEIGMAIDGDKKGQKVYICKNAKCPTHRPKAVAENSEKDLIAEKNKSERGVSNALRLEVFAEALKFFDDVRVLWQFDDLIQKLIVAFLWEVRYQGVQFFSIFKKLGFAPKIFKDKAEVEKFTASLDKAGQSRLLFLLAYRSELAVNYDFTGQDSETAEIRAVCTNFTKLDYDALESEIREKITSEF